MNRMGAGGSSTDHRSYNDPRTTYSSISAGQKRSATCMAFNTAAGCSLPTDRGHCGQGNSKKKHGCTKLLSGGKICLARDHTERTHV